MQLSELDRHAALASWVIARGYHPRDNAASYAIMAEFAGYSAASW
jgi:hypothetical protein